MKRRDCRERTWCVAGLAALCMVVPALAAGPNQNPKLLSFDKGGCGDATITVDILTDSWGGETSWEVTEQGSGTIMGSGSGYANATLYTQDVCVDSTSCYDFTIYDAYGDGIFDPGGYTVSYNGGVIADTMGGLFTGAQETVANIGGGCTVPTGACCEATVCTGTVEEGNCAGDWYSGEDCGSFACPTVAGLNCPGDSLFGQNSMGVGDAWGLGTSEVDVQGTNLLRSESFSGVTGSICDIHWWGTQMVLDGTWFNCTDTNPSFEIKFYQDAGGAPGTEVSSYIVTPTISPTEELLAGSYELFYFSVPSLAPCTTLTDGWVSIQGLGDADCWFMWMASPDGDGSSCLATDGAQDCTGYLYDNALCLTGEYIALFGACCDDSTGTCDDDVELINCSGRFAADTLCSALDPPCGEIPGACCVGVTCSQDTAVGCAAAGGNFLGEGAACLPNICGCADATITIEILTDNYGSETSWELTENGGGVIASGSGLDSDTLYTENVCVSSSSCYTFTIYDAYGDGICCGYGNGYYNVSYNGTLVGSGGEFGASESVEFIGGGCTAPTGACCENDVCTGTGEEGACAGDWYIYEDCATFNCPVAVDTCPGNSLFGQNPDGPDDSWSFGTSEVNVDGTNLLRFESYSVASPICDIHWWGIQAFIGGAGWEGCSDSNSSYEVNFYADAGGVPGALVNSFTVTPSITQTGIIYAGLFDMSYFSVPSLSPCVTEFDGWVSIQGGGDADCWFLWASSHDGDLSSCVMTDGTQDCSTYLFDNAVCLTGEYVAQFGACCDDGTGICDDNVELVNCNGRFAVDTLCSALDPPCGAVPGACCVGLDCSQQSAGACSSAGGTFLGEGTACDPYVCGCSDATITVEIMTDDYPGETSWELVEQGGGVVASGSGYDAGTLNTIEICVSSTSCYDFTIFDAYGDGICCGYGNGYYNVYYEGGLVGSGGEFAASETVGNIGGGCGGAATGACCVAEACTDDVTEPNCAGTWFPSQACGAVNCASGNDVCDGAEDVGALPASVAGDLTGANTENPPACGDNPEGRPAQDRWYSVVGTGGTLSASTCGGATFDTRISVFLDDCAALGCVGGNDDSPCARSTGLRANSLVLVPRIGAAPVPGNAGVMTAGDLRPPAKDPKKAADPQALQSRVDWCSQAGVTYYISIGTYSTITTPGPFTLSVSDLGACSYCAASGGCDEYIERVEIGTIDNSSACDGYADYTALSTDVAVGAPSGITVTIGNGYSSDNGGLWVDWNQDQDFDDADETIPTAWAGTGPYTATITPPAGAALGSTVMRIRLKYFSGDPLPCGATSYGEVEDYSLNVVAAAGACCDGATCSEVEEGDCSGNWLGVGTDCSGDCNGNSAADACDLADGTSLDCNDNDIPDECELAGNDCNGNGAPDECDLADNDCNNNGTPDDCDIAGGGSADCQGDSVPDECQLTGGAARDVVLTEGFEGAFPPAGWENTAFDTNGPWDVTDNPDFIHSGSQSAFHPWSTPDTADSYLLTPELTITSGTISVWSIGSFGQSWDDFYDVDVMIVIGAPGGGDDVFVGNLNDLWEDYFVTWKEGVFDLNPPSTPFRVGFRYYGLDGDLGVIDDVLIEGSTGPPANDCNGNGVPDECDSPDCQDDGIPDDCQLDGNDNVPPGGDGIPDECNGCGDGWIDPASEDCEGGDCCTDQCLFDTGTVCRSAAGDCDAEEACGGASADCPADGYVDAGVGCRSAAGDCDVSESCDGNSPNCPADGFVAAGTECRPSTGDCDPAEDCTGADASCPANAAITECIDDDGCCPDDCTDANDNDCSGAIPTVSEWGLIILALVLAVLGKVYFGRRRVTA